jgi:uncharacterized protein DUF6262
MHRDIEGLRRSARLCREDVTQRALIALSQMESSDREINFRTVAAEARVSTAWLYNQMELRTRIMRLRRSQNWESAPERGDSEAVSRKSVIATLRLRIKKLEETNRELAERLDRAYGVIAEISQVAKSAASSG